MAAAETPEPDTVPEAAPPGDHGQPAPTAGEEPQGEASPGLLPDADAEPAPPPQPEPAAPPAPEPARQRAPKPKRPAVDPADVSRRIGTTNEAALRYVLSPDPKLSRLSRKVRDSLVTDLPPVAAGALLGAEALARHFVASSAAGRYRDLFSLWELFRARPDACKPVLAERQRALERARNALRTAVRLGLRGHAERVVEDIARAEGLIWTWLRQVLLDDLAAVGQRPQVAVALLAREPGLDIPLPREPDERWLAEAAEARQRAALPPAIDRLLSANVDRLPASVATLALVAEHYPDQVKALVGRVDLDARDIGAVLAWARDHGVADRLHERIRAQVTEVSAHERAEGLRLWQLWRDRGVDVPLPQALRAPTLEGLDLARPESAHLLALLLADGAAIDPQAELDGLAATSRTRAEKAYEAFVCAGLDVRLPLALEGNPIVKDGTRCPACQAWTWVRPGHERRCPRRREEVGAVV